MENFLEISGLVIAIIAVLATSLAGAITAFRIAKKENLDVVKKYKKYIADGKLDQKERDDLINELVEAIEANYNFFEICKKIFYKLLPIFKKHQKKTAR